MELWNNFRARQTRRRPRIEQKQKQYTTNTQREKERARERERGGGDENIDNVFRTSPAILYTNVAMISLNSMW